MKKILLTFLLSTSLFAILFSCCPNDPYWEFGTMKLSIQDYDRRDSSVRTATLSIIADLDISYLSDALLPYGNNPFVSSATATRCEPDGYQGMKDPISSINITSNAAFGNFPPNTSLNSIIEYNGQDLSTYNMISFQYDNAYGDAVFEVLQKPTSGSTHVFKVEMTSISGYKYIAITPAVNWY